MNTLPDKLRIPFASFCLGVLFTSLFMWWWMERTKVNIPSDAISIEHKNGSEGEVITACVSGSVSESKVIEIRESEILKDVLRINVEIADGANVDNVIELCPGLDYEKAYYIPPVNSSNVAGAEVVSTIEATPSGKVSLNNASQSDLESLPGIGPAYASRIIDARPFVSLIDVKRVKGIGDKTYEKILPYISL